MNSSDQIKKGAAISYVAIFLNIAAGLLYTPWMVRQIGVSDYGLYALVGAFLTYFIMDFGLGSAIARFVARARAKNDDAGVTRLISTTTRIYLAIDGIIALALCVTFFFLSGIFSEFTPEEIHKFKVIYCVAGLFSIFSFPFMPQNGILIAYERFVALKMCDMLQKMSVIVLMVLALLCGFGLYALVLVNGLVGFAIAIYKFFYITHRVGVRIHIGVFDRGLAKSLFNFSVWTFIIGIAQRLIINIVPTLLGIFSVTTQIAVFSIGMTLEAYTYTFANALNGLFMPRVARLSVKNQPRARINELMVRVGRIQLLIIGLIITGIVVLGRPFINLWMGRSFDGSYLVALCLIVPGIVSLTQEIANSLLFVENKVRYKALILSGASLVSVAIGSALATRMGAVGTAIGVTVALVLCHIVGMNIVFAKVLKLDIPGFFRECHLKMLPPMVLAGFFSLALQYFFPIHNWWIFLGQGAVLAVVFYALMWLLSMNQYEKSLLKEIIMPIISKIKHV